jgi:hypothetical protein
MPEDPREEKTDALGFIGGWKGLFLLVLAYGVLQIVLLYLFTISVNHS